MIFSNTYRNLSILAILLAAVFCACSSVGGDKSGLTSAPADQLGVGMMLQADGGAPPPSLPPSRPRNTV